MSTNENARPVGGGSGVVFPNVDTKRQRNTITANGVQDANHICDRSAKLRPKPKGPHVPGRARGAKNTPYCLGNRADSEPILHASESIGKSAKPRLMWQQVNSATWRLVDPDAPQLRIEASHGQWGGYHYPKALAYVFDVGESGHEWRIRVRQRGNQWRAFGCVIDVAAAKQIAQEAVENPTEPKPSKFNIPLNLLGGERSDAPKLDPQTYAYIRDVEIGAVKVESLNEQPESSPDDESINSSADDDGWIDWPGAVDVFGG